MDACICVCCFVQMGRRLSRGSGMICASGILFLSGNVDLSEGVMVVRNGCVQEGVVWERDGVASASYE